MADIGLEEANRIRVAMGLKPIGVSGASGSAPSFKESNALPGEEAASTLETREAAAGENWQKIQEEEATKAKRKAHKEAVKKARDAAQRDMKMTGKTLGDFDDNADTTTWLRQQSKRQKKIEKARKLEEELAAREELAEYTSKDLAGVKVGHQLSQFDSGAEQVLTLKDAIIGEESEDDELENIDLRDQEKLQQRVELKKRKPVYNPNDDDETGEKSILAHYDEEIIGQKRSQFTLDGLGSTREGALHDAEDEKQKSKGIVINLDVLRDDKPVSDYLEPSAVKMKKRKKSKSTRIKKIEHDDILPAAVSMVVDEPPQILSSISKKRSLDDTNFVDDDDLQAKLAQQRREALRKKKKFRPEDLAKQLREEEESAMDGVQESGEDATGLVFDETSWFVNHLEAPEDREEEKRPGRVRSKSAKARESDSEGDVEMHEAENGAEPKHISESVEAEDSAAAEKGVAGLEEESTIDKGIGSTLSMLRQRRHLEDDRHGDAQTYREYQSFLAKKRGREDDAEREARRQREYDRQSEHYKNMSARDREDVARKHNTQREQFESRAAADLFNKEYKPNVELKYIDEFGRSMNQKEAFKHLSHQFHGKGSGKQKHEKRLKKIGEEKKREAMSTLDSSQHVSSNAMGNKAKKNQQAGVRLQ